MTETKQDILNKHLLRGYEDIKRTMPKKYNTYILMAMEEYAQLKNQKEPSAEELFLSIVNGLEIKIYHKEYPDSVFFFKGDKWYFEREKNGDLWCNYHLVWKVLQAKLNTDYTGTQAFIKTMVEEHLKLGSVTPWNLNAMLFNRWKNI